MRVLLASDPSARADATLAEQYQATDRRLTALEAYVRSLAPAEEADAERAVGGLAATWAKLDALRSLEPGALERLSEFDGYSAMIQRLNDMTTDLGHGTDIRTAREAEAFVTLVGLTESVAQERGLGALLLSGDLPEGARHDALVRLGVTDSLQGALSQQLLRASNTRLGPTWRAIEAAPASVAARTMRRDVLAPGSATVTPTEWFATLSARLDLMYDLEGRVAYDLVGDAAGLSARQGSQMWMVGLGTALLLLVSSGGAYVVARSVSRPVERLARTATRLADGDVSGNAYVVSTDALGELATAFDSMIARQRELTEAANEIAADRLDVEVDVRSDQDELGRALGKMLHRLRTSRADLENAAREASALAEREHAASESARRLAREDGLTSCLNRSTFLHEVERALADAAACGDERRLLFIDLDGFKNVNDSFGHSAGDDVLRLVVDRLQELLADRDVVGRVGGDEFAVLMQSAHWASAATGRHRPTRRARCDDRRGPYPSVSFAMPSEANSLSISRLAQRNRRPAGRSFITNELSCLCSFRNGLLQTGVCCLSGGRGTPGCSSGSCGNSGRFPANSSRPWLGL